MEKEFVTYEQSLALKELGFNDYCYRGYDKNQMLFYSEQEFGHLLNYSVGMNVSAPLKQQVFRWFREKYNLYGHVRESWSFENTLEFVSQINGMHVNHGIPDKPINRFATYEEAENACIDKLIELAKKQTK